MHQKFILHIAFPEDERLKDRHLYDWQTNFKNITDPVVNILAPLSLKTRKALYERLSTLTTEPIVAVLYPQPLKSYMTMCTDTFENIKTLQNYSDYSNMQPPVQTIDCDEMQLADQSISLYEAVLADKNQFPDLDTHGTPHHKETISEHAVMVAEQLVKMTINKELGQLRHVSPFSKSKDIDILHTIALHHDLGKYWTKQPDEKAGYMRYPNHENVSAMIFVTEMLLKPEKYSFLNNTQMTDDDDAYVLFDSYRQAFTKIVTQVILNHMFVKTDGYTPKTIRRRNLTEYEQHLLNIFSEADNRGRIK